MAASSKTGTGNKSPADQKNETTDTDDDTHEPVIEGPKSARARRPDVKVVKVDGKTPATPAGAVLAVKSDAATPKDKPARGGKGRAGKKAKSDKSGAAEASTEDADVTQNNKDDNVLRAKELISLVTERSGVPRKLVRQVVEAVSVELGEAFRQNRELNLRGLGKIKPQRSFHKGDVHISIIKVRQKSLDAAAPKDADPTDDTSDD